jgi:hypothetical protein
VQRLGAAEAYKDVIYEVNQGQRLHERPTTRSKGSEIVPVEAKKPSVDLATDPLPFQLRRYAHSTGLSLSVLTDFWRSTTRSSPHRQGGVGRVLIWKCEEYLDKLDEWGPSKGRFSGTFGRFPRASAARCPSTRASGHRAVAGELAKHRARNRR